MSRTLHGTPVPSGASAASGSPTGTRPPSAVWRATTGGAMRTFAPSISRPPFRAHPERAPPPPHPHPHPRPPLRPDLTCPGTDTHPPDHLTPKAPVSTSVVFIQPRILVQFSLKLNLFLKLDRSARYSTLKVGANWGLTRWAPIRRNSYSNFAHTNLGKITDTWPRASSSEIQWARMSQAGTDWNCLKRKRLRQIRNRAPKLDTKWSQ